MESVQGFDGGNKRKGPQGPCVGVRSSTMELVDCSEGASHCHPISSVYDFDWQT
ncbi:hypothetical protein FORC37_1230 [Vibrio vulnificus]|nr:hypothetical protein FORC37_1230 [Vibrio vulnificus]